MRAWSGLGLLPVLSPLSILVSLNPHVCVSSPLSKHTTAAREVRQGQVRAPGPAVQEDARHPPAAHQARGACVGICRFGATAVAVSGVLMCSPFLSLSRVFQSSRRPSRRSGSRSARRPSPSGGTPSRPKPLGGRRHCGAGGWRGETTGAHAGRLGGVGRKEGVEGIIYS